jgi:catechol 2,3-dioxygenase-like lactoylglutathione lyase family enzyme
MKINQIKETCLYVSDLNTVKTFYSEKLGLELMSFVENNHVFFRAGSSVLLCFNAEVTKNKTEIPPHYGAGDIHFAFEVDAADYEGSKQEIIDAGIEIEQEVDWGVGMRSFYFRDPENNLVEIVQVGFWERLIAAGQ